LNYREILEQFKSHVPSMRAIIFCDHEGEAIEFVSEFDSYHTQLFGAYHSELMLHCKTAAKHLPVGNLLSLELRTSLGAVSLWPIGSHYYLAVMTKVPLSSTHPAVAWVRKTLEAEV
jgi:predicted regulator of Ras-like GTPase activity (Roadblock/LC7/MglB family)